MKPEECQGLEALFHAYRPELLRFVVAQTGNRAEAQDILQEMWVRLRKPAGGPVANPRPYLYRMAKNLVVDRLRENHRRMRRDRGWSDHQDDHLQPGGEPADRTGNAEHQLLEREELALLASALTTIPQGARRALELHKLDGLSQAEVAERLGISISGVEKHIAVAMKYLRRALLD
ncbi:RNA polymerase sigma factor [Sphingobium sp. H39-3-25]|uniref:RNA polymerase sigma factor n=1 Tax=Sphingobium arseniciresistens TaxID=3030834 RepID=UPI0023B9EAA1|nr:RNA polymerase sigma factor [Sphingobium arseniciresistens]